MRRTYVIRTVGNEKHRLETENPKEGETESGGAVPQRQDPPRKGMEFGSTSRGPLIDIESTIGWKRLRQRGML